MEEFDIISEIDKHQKELTQALVNGGSDLAEDNKIRGRILGLEMAKGIIHDLFARFSSGEDSGSDIDEV